MNRETTGFQNSDTLVVVDRSTRRKRIALIAAVLVVIVAAALFFMSGGDEPAAAPAGGPGAGRGSGQVPTVTVLVPGRSEVARIVTASGELGARRDQPVGIPGEGGQVTRVLVDAGSWVRQGQLLASIDRSVQSQEAQQLAAAIQVARADAALAQNELDRAEALVDRGFVSKADVDRRRAARDAANARVRVAQAQLGAARARIGRLDIRAPTSGLVLERNVEVGQVVGAGAGALFRMARGGDLEMVASVAQQDLAAMRTGLPARITPVGSARTFDGSVWQVSPVIDPATRQGEVRIAVPYDPQLRPGGFAEARITAGTTTTPVLPQSAVQSDAKGNFVYLLNDRNEVVRRNVSIGEISEAGVAIASGLTGQEVVIQTAGPFLNPGQKVRPKRVAAESARASAQAGE